MNGPEWNTLRDALGWLHRRILYDAVEIEFIGYDEKIFKRSEGSTLADRLCWMLDQGDELIGVQLRGGSHVGPRLKKQNLRDRWIGLEEEDRASIQTEEAAVRVLRQLLGFNEQSLDTSTNPLAEKSTRLE